MPSYESLAVELRVPLEPLRGLGHNERWKAPQSLRLSVSGLCLAWQLRLFPRGLTTAKGSLLTGARLSLTPLEADLFYRSDGGVSISLRVLWRAAGKGVWHPSLPASVELFGLASLRLAEKEKDFVDVLGGSETHLQLRILLRLEMSFVTPLGFLESFETTQLEKCPPSNRKLDALAKFARLAGDVEVRCKDGSLRSAKVLLASQSEYFDKLFSFNKENDKGESQVDLELYPKVVVELVLEQLSTGRVKPEAVRELSMEDTKLLLDLKNQVDEYNNEVFESIVERKLAAGLSEGLSAGEVAEKLALADVYDFQVLKNLCLCRLLHLGPAAFFMDDKVAMTLSKGLREEVAAAFSDKHFLRQFQGTRFEDDDGAKSD